MPAENPLRPGTPSQFETLRELFRSSGFCETAICQRLGIPAFTKFGTVQPFSRLTEGLASPLDALIRIFLECEPAPRADLEKLLGANVAILESLGLIVPHPKDPSCLVACVGLCPTRGLYLVSDLGGELGKLREDVVYPAILENTQHFLELIPTSPCETFLDIGTGTGVAALLAAKNFARHAWAFDIAPRSAEFAEFNRQLNGLENVTVGLGDLFEPAGDLRFDRIVTHPPYVPVPTPTYIFRDGGDDGEQIVRRAIEGLPLHLAPGGRFYALTLISDREGESAEDRVRGWLGETGPEFDVALIAETAREPFDFLGRAMQKGNHQLEELQYWSSTYRSRKVRYLVYGTILVQRHDNSRPPFTLRLMKGPRSGHAETEWALRWHGAMASADAASRVLSSRLTASPHLNLAVLHRTRDGELSPEEFLVRVQYPFEAECKCPAWVVALIPACDGSRTGAEVFAHLKASGAIHEGSEEDEFAEVMRVFISSGFVKSDSFDFGDVQYPPSRDM